MVNYSFLTSQMPISEKMVETNHLGAALKARPHILKSAVDELFATKMYSGNALSSTLMSGKKVETIEQTTWSYQLMGGRCRPTTILASEYNPSTGAGAGRGKTPITLYGDFGGYLAGDIIAPTNGNKEYQCRLIYDAQQVGNRFKYIVRPMQDSLSGTIPARYLTAGAQWGKLFSIYEEGSDQSGSTSFNTSIGLTGSMSRFRKMYKITSDAKNEALGVQIQAKTPNGGMAKTNYWIKYAELVYWQQWYMELDKGYWYTRNTKTVLGSNGRPILSGAGIQQQLTSGVRHYYNTLTAELIQEFVMDMRYGRILPGSNNTIYAYTGEYGLHAFSNALSNNASKQPIFTMLTDNFVRKADAPYTQHGLSYGAQFVEYVMPNGVKLKLIHNPVYDDPEINGEIDPLTGKPIESMRFTFLDVAGSGQDANITLVNKKNGFKNWYVGGSDGPFGPITNGALGSHSGDYYEMHLLDMQGINLNDPTKCGELILQR